ncbi:hypothetical protein BDM02DRAFT_3181472 [Thelephora ganbajun]|uniref:Uncharacterized protein n=1 Tax=Thelephora ganbajun TaxID=370292 RepID=A0ACB6Z5R6_THEGA|nr:hypothetical protein BDM02DRAFT_3181472 [Thelephora ganbajun]
MVRLLFFLAIAGCNKNYKKGSPIVPPGGQFPVPPTSDSTLLAFRCTPTYKPYIAEDVTSGAGFIIDTIVTHTQVRGAKPITLEPAAESLFVSISVGRNVLVVGWVPVNETNFEIPFSLTKLMPRKEPYTISCSATYLGNQSYTTNTPLSYLPNPPSGSITKFDSRTGGLWTKVFGVGRAVHYTPVFPLGFYTSFDDYLAKDLSVHPIPTFGNLTALELVLDRMEELGLYLMYDMRWSYKNLSAVEEEVTRIKYRKNLLLWYTADEPDGWEDPFDAASFAYDKIYDIDGYHPVSLVLNCQDYEFEAYTTGADIVMQDAYVIGINATHSVVWNTECTVDYGDCGCDNCIGEFEDISRRIDQFGDRLRALSWERTKAIWTVSQAFGGSSYWSRVPTGKEWVVQSLLAVTHGALGIIPWTDPTSGDIKTAATTLSQRLVPSLTSFALNPHVTFATYVWQRVHFGVWRVGDQTLVVGVNLNPEVRWISLARLPGWRRYTKLEVVYNGGASFESENLSLWDLGSVGFIVTM